MKGHPLTRPVSFNGNSRRPFALGQTHFDPQLHLAVVSSNRLFAGVRYADFGMNEKIAFNRKFSKWKRSASPDLK